MTDGTMSGPDFLEACASRFEANDLHIEADEMRRRAREWSTDKQTIENGTFAAALEQRQDGILVNAIEADFETNMIKVQAKSADFRIGTGTYQLVPVMSP